MSRHRTITITAVPPSPRGFRPRVPFLGAADPSVADRFVAALGEVFRDADLAILRFEKRAEREGWGSALRELRHNPRSFGRLQGSSFFGVVPGGRRDRALARLPELVRLAERYLANRPVSPRDSEPVSQPARPVRTPILLRPWFRPAAAAMTTVLAQ